MTDIENPTALQRIVNDEEVQNMIETIEEHDLEELDGLEVKLAIDSSHVPHLLEELEEMTNDEP